MPTTLKTERFQVRSEEEIVRVRQETRKWSGELAFSLVDQTKMVTAASEIARNCVIYGGGGYVDFDLIENAGRRGLRLSFVDQGPGIASVEVALRDGYTSGSGLGLGLGGAKRLVNEFDIQSQPGAGTRVTLTRWK